MIIDATHVKELIHLIHLGQRGEDTFLELKGVAKNNYKVNGDNFAKAVTALANTRGGHIFLGVEDDGTVSGIGNGQQADALMRQVTQICQDKMQPPIVTTLSRVVVAEKSILVVEVPGFSPHRPYSVDGVFSIRDGNRSRPALGHELRRLLESENFHYDERPVQGSSMDDLDSSIFQSFCQTAYGGHCQPDQVDPYLKALHSITDDNIPTVTGMLFFGQNPLRFLPDAMISAIRIAGTEISSEKIMDRKEIGGRLLDQIDVAMKFLQLHLPNPYSIVGLDRVERGVPEFVLREALINAIAHRDYRMASQVRILVFDNRTEIINPGVLLNKMTLDSIRIGGMSQRRNPAVSGLIKLAFRRESVGFGVPEMIRVMRERGLPEPEFDLPGGHFRIILRMKGASP
jgi:ATP-dependent DNA helicase RecG